MSVAPHRGRAAWMLVVATACWSLSFPCMKALAQFQNQQEPAWSSWFIAALSLVYRFGIGACVLTALEYRHLRHLTRLELWEGAVLGLLTSAGLILQMDALARQGPDGLHASVSAFLTQCYCVIIPVWIGLRERRWPAPRTLLCVGLVVIGVAVLARLDWRTLKLGRGEIETLLASVVFTAQILWLQRPCFAVNRVGNFTWVMFVVIALSALPLAWATATRPADLWLAVSHVPAQTLMAVLVIFCTLGGFLLMNHWQPLVSATEAGLIYCAEPLFASLLTLFLPAWLSRFANVNYANETLTASLLLGGVLITAANVIIQWPASGPATNPPEAARPTA